MNECTTRRQRGINRRQRYATERGRSDRDRAARDDTYPPPGTARNAPTRLIVAVVQDYDANAITDALTQANFRLTRVGSTGGFLRMGSTTLLVGVEDWQVSASSG